MKWILYLYSCLFLHQYVFSMTPEFLEERLRSRRGYSVLTITRDYSKYDTYQLNHENLSAVLEAADQTLNDIVNPVFVVLNEYLCSRKTLEYSEFVQLLNAVMEHSNKHPNAIYYINFLHKLENGISLEEMHKLKIYMQSVDDLLIEERDRDKKYTWPIINSDSRDKTLFEDPARVFANESFVINQGILISTYRKSTYCKEDAALLQEGWSYYYGFGHDIQPFRSCY